MQEPINGEHLALVRPMLPLFVDKLRQLHPCTFDVTIQALSVSTFAFRHLVHRSKTPYPILCRTFLLELVHIAESSLPLPGQCADLNEGWLLSW